MVRFITTFYGRINDRLVEMVETRSQDEPAVNENKFEGWVEVMVDGEGVCLLREDLYTHYDPLDISEE